LAGANAAARMPTISEVKSDPSGANGDAAQSQEKKEDKQMKNAQLKDNLEDDTKESDKLLDEGCTKPPAKQKQKCDPFFYLKI
jgi:hypothetical protein